MNGSKDPIAGLDPAVSGAPATSGAPPRLVSWLGYGGLAPFLGALVWGALAASHVAPARAALFAYAAVILSFVGALHWGLAMALPALTQARRDAMFAWSVVPALMAWLALLCPMSVAAPLLLAGFALQLGQDLRLAPGAGLPPWYLPLRVRLSVGACLGIALGALSLR